jgi:hypothetical protein
MVRMGVSEQYSVYLFQAGAQGLLAEVSRSVYQDVMAVL